MTSSFRHTHRNNLVPVQYHKRNNEKAEDTDSNQTELQSISCAYLERIADVPQTV